MMALNGHSGNSSPDLPINLVSVQQAILEQQEDGRDEISDKIDSIVFQKRSDRESVYHHSIAKAPTTKDDLRYNMKHMKRGKAIIFNNKDFSPALGLRARNGTDVDRDKLFLKLRELDFEVYCYNDLTLNGIEGVLKSLSKEDHSDKDTIMITVLSHGEAGILFAKDTCYKPEILWSSFTADRCPTLAGKPKLFFIQACQGDRLDSGTLLSKQGITETDSGSFSYKIPSHADFLICYSTIPGFFSWRNTTNGSWFVQALCKVLGEHYRTTHLLDMMTIVNQIVAFDYESNCPGDAVMHQKKQIPCITSLLTRQVFFEPK